MTITPSRFRTFLALLCLALAPGLAFAAPAAVEGTDYALVQDARPYQALGGKIEVAEVFAYWCGHCADFQPMVDAWKRKLPGNVRLIYVPLPSGRDDAFARGYFAASDAKALDRTHASLFRAVHDQKSVPSNPSTGELAAFYAQHGLNAARMQAAMDSPAMAERIAQARQFAVRSGVEGTPSLVINGRYRVLGDSFEALLGNADKVIAQLRAAAR